MTKIAYVGFELGRFVEKFFKTTISKYVCTNFGGSKQNC